MLAVKIDVPNFVSDLKLIYVFDPYLNDVWLGVNMKKNIKTYLEKNWTTCSKFVMHSRCNNQHNFFFFWGGGHV